MTLLDVGFWFFMILTIVGAAANVLMIGQPRDPLSPGSALVVLIISTLELLVLIGLYLR